MDHHDSELKEKILKSTKMEKVKTDDFRKVQEYLKGKSIENASMAFKIRSEMVEDIKGNFNPNLHGGAKSAPLLYIVDSAQNYIFVNLDTSWLFLTTIYGHFKPLLKFLQ